MTLLPYVISNVVKADLNSLTAVLYAQLVASKDSATLQGRLIGLFTSDAQVIAQATAILPVIAFVMVSSCTAIQLVVPGGNALAVVDQ